MAEHVRTEDADSAYISLSIATGELNTVHYDASQVFRLNSFEKNLKLLKKYVASSPYMDKLSKIAMKYIPEFENVLLKLEYIRSNPDYADVDNKEQCAE